LPEAAVQVEMLPLSRDAVHGLRDREEFDLGVFLIGEAIAPRGALVGCKVARRPEPYGELKFDPVWDEFAGHPRFEKSSRRLRRSR